MGQPHTFAQDCHVAIIVEEIGIDQRSVLRISPGKANGPATFGTQHTGVQREAVPLHLGSAMVFQHGRDEVPLHVRGGGIGHDLPETACLGIGRGHDARPLAPMFENGLGHADGAGQTVTDEVPAFGLPAGDVVDMILQVAAHGRLVDHHVDAVIFQMGGGPDPGKHQDLRRIEGASRQHHGAAGLHLSLPVADRIGHAGDTTFLDIQLLHADADADVQIPRAP